MEGEFLGCVIFLAVTLLGAWVLDKIGVEL